MPLIRRTMVTQQCPQQVVVAGERNHRVYHPLPTYASVSSRRTSLDHDTSKFHEVPLPNSRVIHVTLRVGVLDAVVVARDVRQPPTMLDHLALNIIVVAPLHLSMVTTVHLDVSNLVGTQRSKELNKVIQITSNNNVTSSRATQIGRKHWASQSIHYGIVVPTVDI